MVVKGNITFLTTPPSEKSDTLPQTLDKIAFVNKKLSHLANKKVSQL